MSHWKPSLRIGEVTSGWSSDHHVAFATLIGKLSMTRALLDRVAPQMPTHYEALVGNWLLATNTAVLLLTNAELFDGAAWKPSMAILRVSDGFPRSGGDPTTGVIELLTLLRSLAYALFALDVGSEALEGHKDDVANALQDAAELLADAEGLPRIAPWVSPQPEGAIEARAAAVARLG